MGLFDPFRDYRNEHTIYFLVLLIVILLWAYILRLAMLYALAHLFHIRLIYL
jgi:hypothetical protein